MTRQLCIALHDVAPATWDLSRRLLDLVKRVGNPPVTLLVVPNFHGRGRPAESPSFVDAIARHLANGSEVALHGYFHRDDAPAPRSPPAWLRRRVLTCGEGEFSALPFREAALRIRQGRQEFGDLSWDVCGFVAPAWLANAATWSALRQSPLGYASTRNALVRLSDLRRIPAPAIALSARSRARRAASRLWLRAMCRTTTASPIVRLALHPIDALYPDMLADWELALRSLLDEREPVTKRHALGLG